MCFGIFNRGSGHAQPNSLHYIKPKDSRASTLKTRAPNNQAARLARKAKKSDSKYDTGSAEKTAQIKRPRNFSFFGHADEDIVRKQTTTFEGLAKRGVIPDSALEPLTKAEEGRLSAVSRSALR